MAQFQFNAREVEPDQGRVGSIPAGWYKTMVMSTELKPTGGGTGLAISVGARVLEGKFTGAVFFTNFNVQNASEKAVEIGRKQLSALCHATGVLDMTDTDQLKNIPFFTRLKLTPAVMDPEDPTKVQYEEKNEPSAFKHITDQMAIAKAAEVAAGPAGAPAQAPRPPAPPAQAPQQFVPQQQPQYQPPAQPQYQAPPAAAPQPQYQAPPQQFTPPPVAAPQAQYQPPQPQFQAPPVNTAPAGQPDWASAPAQPWGAAPAAQQAQAAHAAPPATPEQQAAYAATQTASPPWGAPA